MLRRSKSSTVQNSPSRRWVWRSALALGAFALACFVVAVRASGFFESDVPPKTRAFITEEARALDGISDGRLVEEPCAPALSQFVATTFQDRTLRCGRVAARQLSPRLHPVSLFVQMVGCSAGRARGPRIGCRLPPLVVFAGGPGDAHSLDLQERVSDWIARVGERALIFIDARGAGRSLPVLSCPSAISRNKDLQNCFERWNQELDLEEYDTAHHVRDAVQVLDALGVSEVAVYGVSYGTHLATEFVRADPQRVGLLILDSPIPRSTDVLAAIGRNARAALDELLTDCHRQPDCPRGASTKELEKLVVRLDSSRQDPSARSGLSGTQLAAGIVDFMSAPSVLPYIPLIVSRALQGDFRLFHALDDGGHGGLSFPWGMHLSVQCAERYPLTSAESMTRLDATVGQGFLEAWSGKHYLEYCSIWKVSPRPVVGLGSKLLVRTLVASGTYDPVTPYSYAENVAADFTHAELIRIPGVGHGALLTACGGKVMRRFLDSAGAVPELPACDPPRFATSTPTARQVSRMRHDIYHRL